MAIQDISSLSVGVGGQAVTPSNTVGASLSQVARVLWIGTAGNLSIRTADGTNLFFENLPVGFFDRAAVRDVYATTGGTTTAAKIIALY